MHRPLPSRSVVALVALTATIGLVACGGSDDDAADALDVAATAAPASASTTSSASATDRAVPATTTGTASDADPPIDLSGVTLRVATQPGDFRRVQLEESGVLDDLPFDIEWSVFDGINSSVEALQAGAIDIAITTNGPAPVLAQANAGTAWTAESAPFKIVGAQLAGSELSSQSIVLPADSDVQSIEDLRGKTVAFAKGGPGHHYFIKALELAGIEPSEVEITTMPLAEAKAAFAGGALDALVTAYGGNALPLVEQTGARVLSTAFGVIPTYTLDLAATAALDDPAMSAAIGELLVREVRFDHWETQNAAEYEELAVSVDKQTPEDAARSAETSAANVYVPIDADLVSEEQSQAELFHEQGLAAALVDVSIAIDDRFNDVVSAALAATS